MRIRVVCVLALSVTFALFMPMIMAAGRMLYVDDDFGTSASSDLWSIGLSVVLGMVAAAGLWIADTRQSKVPLVVLPLGIIVSLGAGYGNTAFAFRQATAYFDILTSDCYYANALASRGRTGVFVSWNGRTAFHPIEKIQSMNRLPTDPASPAVAGRPMMKNTRNGME